MSQARRDEVFAGLKAAEDLQRMSQRQKAEAVLSLDRQAQERFVANMSFEAADLERMNPELVARSTGRLDANARSQIFASLQAAENLERWSAERKFGAALALDRGARQELAANLSFEAADLQRMNPELVARSIERLDANARSQIFASLQAAENLERWSAERKFGAALALDRGARQELAANLSFEAADLQRMNPELVARSIERLDANARSELAASLEAAANFERMSLQQKASCADLLGAGACERAVLEARAFNRLSAAQQRAVWHELGRTGQEAALRHAGFEASLARGDALHREAQFERFMSERSARQ